MNAHFVNIKVDREERPDVDAVYMKVAGGALDGITRQTIITIAKDLGIEVVERRITRDEFYIADEAFFTGTAEVTPIREYDDRQIGEGSRGPITTQIQKAYFDAVQE